MPSLLCTGTPSLRHGNSHHLLLHSSAVAQRGARDVDSDARRQPATVVAVMPDSGVKYLSKIFNDEWMDKKGYKNYNA